MDQHGQCLSHATTFGHGPDVKQKRYEALKEESDLYPPTPVQGYETPSPKISPTVYHPADYKDKTSSVHANNPPISNPPAVYGDKISSPRAPVAVRMTFKERLLQEAVQQWKARESVDQLRKLMHYDDDNDHSYLPEPEDLRSERRRYESYVHNNTVRNRRPFHVYGTNDLYEHDRLRLWVKLHLHLNPETPFPPDYEAINGNSEEVSIAGTLYSQELSTAESSDSDPA